MIWKNNFRIRMKSYRNIKIMFQNWLENWETLNKYIQLTLKH